MLITAPTARQQGCVNATCSLAILSKQPALWLFGCLPLTCRSATCQRGGPGKLSSYWEDKVNVVMKKKRVLTAVFMKLCVTWELFVTCSSLPVDTTREMGQRQSAGVKIYESDKRSVGEPWWQRRGASQILNKATKELALLTQRRCLLPQDWQEEWQTRTTDCGNWLARIFGKGRSLKTM